MAVDGDLLKRVGVSAAVLHACHVGQSQTQPAGTLLLSRFAIGFGNFPEHIGPLGIARQEHHTGVAGLSGGCTQLGFDGFEIPVALFLTLGHLPNKGFLALAAVERNSQITGDLTQLTQGQTCQG